MPAHNQEAGGAVTYLLILVGGLVVGFLVGVNFEREFTEERVMARPWDEKDWWG